MSPLAGGPGPARALLTLALLLCQADITIPPIFNFWKLMPLPNAPKCRSTAAEDRQYKKGDIRKHFVIIKVSVNLHSFK